MMSRILDIGIPKDLPRKNGTLINYFGSKIVNDTNGHVSVGIFMNLIG